MDNSRFVSDEDLFRHQMETITIGFQSSGASRAQRRELKGKVAELERRLKFAQDKCELMENYLRSIGVLR